MSDTETTLTYDELAAQATYLNNELERVNRLTTYFQQLLQEERKARSDRYAELESYLDENWDDMGDHAEPIADIFGIETTKTVMVSMTVDFEVQVTVPRASVDDLDEFDFTFEVSLNKDGGVEESSDEVTAFSVNV